MFMEQCYGRADLTGRAIAALETVVLEKSRLYRMKFASLLQAFDGDNLVALVHDCERKAAVDAAAVCKHRACAALSVVAALFRAGQSKILAKKIQKSDARINGHVVVLAIDLQFEFDRNTACGGGCGRFLHRCRPSLVQRHSESDSAGQHSHRGHESTA